MFCLASRFRALALRGGITFAGALATLTVCVTPLVAQEPQTATEALHALFDAEWERAMYENPTWASTLGDRRYNDRWPDIGLDARDRRHQADQDVLLQLAGIDPGALPADERLNYDLFKQRYEDRIAGYGFRTFLMPIGHRGGIQTADELHERLRFETLEDYEDWVARLNALGDYMDQTLTLLRTGVAERRVPPRVTMERVPEQIEAQIASKPSESPFYAPFRDVPSTIDDMTRRNLDREARWAIQEVVIPAYRRLLRYFRDAYLPATRETVGAWDLPEGAEYYAHRVRIYTTTTMTPEEIHLLGLQEVARIRHAMENVKSRAGFNGDLASFFEFLRNDPQFYYEDPDELYEAYALVCKRIEPELVKLFGRLPRMPYGLRPVPDKIAPHTTTAYYSRPAADGSRAGYFYINLYKPEARPIYEIEVLSAHEAMPGHHLQIALAMERGELPNFRRYTGYTAYVEGWGLYSESLGDDLGLYQDHYSKFGQLTYEMWRAVRLVVDTGLHHMKWDRDRAIKYFLDNAAKTEHDIVNEVDRYIGTPGQALAYKIGELKIKEIRTYAEERLGERFDVREFHDTVLETGAVPLQVLEQHVRRWVDRSLSAGAAGGTGSTETP